MADYPGCCGEESSYGEREELIEEAGEERRPGRRRVWQVLHLGQGVANLVDSSLVEVGI